MCLGKSPKETTDNWITSISPRTGSDNQIITIQYAENTDNMQRVAVLTLAATGEGATERVNITLTQSGRFYSAASDPSQDSSLQIKAISPTADAGRVTFNVTANVPWEINQPSPVPWITDITPFRGRDNQQITIQYNENNTSASRDATLTLSLPPMQERPKRYALPSPKQPLLLLLLLLLLSGFPHLRSTCVSTPIPLLKPSI